MDQISPSKFYQKHPVTPRCNVHPAWCLMMYLPFCDINNHKDANMVLISSVYMLCI